jgi:hypothetical protein
MRRQLALISLAILGTVLAARVWAQPPWRQAQGWSGQGFQGYWMGVDPLDGGDSRRSLVQRHDGRFALAGRDTVLTLCDETDRGFIAFADGQVVGRNVMQSETLTIQCFNLSASVVLRARYELLGNGLMVEVTTQQDGTPASRIVFHKVSQD